MFEVELEVGLGLTTEKKVKWGLGLAGLELVFAQGLVLVTGRPFGSALRMME